MSAATSPAAASVVTIRLSSGLPMARPKMTGVAPPRRRASSANALASCEGRAGLCRHREHGGDAGNDGDIERAPCLRPALDRLAYRSCHGEHAGIAARDDCRAAASRRMAKCGFRARALLAIVGRMPRLTLLDWNAIKVWSVAIDRIGRCQRLLGLAREMARVTGAEPDDREAPAQLRPSQPGTSTMAK